MVGRRERDVVPEVLLAAVLEFDVGARAARVAAVERLRTIALDSTPAARGLPVGSGSMLAYSALASGTVPV